MPADDRLLAELRALAVRLAAEAASVHRAALGRVRHVETKSSRTDLVSEVDREAERLIVQGIVAARPHDAVVGEEGASRPGTTGVRWIVDPLDGTTNYLYRFPAFSVSIGVEVDGEAAVGVVHDTAHDVVYSAARGRGATRDGEPMAASRCDELATALVATGFQYRPEIRNRQAAILSQVLPAVRDVRRAGSAALDLSWVGDGRLDAFYEAGLAEWDMAAGQLIAREAGAAVLRIVVPGGPSPLVVAAAPALLEPLLALLRGAGALG